MITLKHILVATDFSECSAAAVEQAGALAAAFDASLHLLHVAIAPLHEPWAGEAPGERFVHIVRRLEADARSVASGWPRAATILARPRLSDAFGIV